MFCQLLPPIMLGGIFCHLHRPEICSNIRQQHNSLGIAATNKCWKTFFATCTRDMQQLQTEAQLWHKFCRILYPCYQNVIQNGNLYPLLITSIQHACNWCFHPIVATQSRQVLGENYVTTVINSKHKAFIKGKIYSIVMMAQLAHYFEN